MRKEEQMEEKPRGATTNERERKRRGRDELLWKSDSYGRVTSDSYGRVTKPVRFSNGNTRLRVFPEFIDETERDCISIPISQTVDEITASAPKSPLILHKLPTPTDQDKISEQVEQASVHQLLSIFQPTPSYSHVQLSADIGLPPVFVNWLNMFNRPSSELLAELEHQSSLETVMNNAHSSQIPQLPFVPSFPRKSADIFPYNSIAFACPLRSCGENIERSEEPFVLAERISRNLVIPIDADCSHPMFSQFIRIVRKLEETMLNSTPLFRRNVLVLPTASGDLPTCGLQTKNHRRASEIPIPTGRLAQSTSPHSLPSITHKPSSNRRPPIDSDESEEISIPSSSLFPFGAAVAKTKSLQQQTGPFAIDPNCNSSELREILIQGITGSPSESKQRINAAVERSLDGSFSVMCAECAFSYLAHTIQYCHHSSANVTFPGGRSTRSAQFE